MSHVSSSYNDNRRAGRTSATLRNAVENFLQGKDVLYVCYAAQAGQTFCAMAANLVRAIVKESFEEFHVSHDRIHGPRGNSIRFVTEETRASGVRGIVIPDHYTYEKLASDSVTQITSLSEKVRDLEAQLQIVVDRKDSVTQITSLSEKVRDLEAQLQIVVDRKRRRNQRLREARAAKKALL